MRYELIIQRKLNYSDSDSGEATYLDTFQDESISLNYNIADINDLSNKNSSYSKTIKLPNTARNRRAFFNIFNIETTVEYQEGPYVFNPNIKVKAWLLQDGLTIFEGNLQLTNINYDYDNNIHSYDIVVYSENDGLFKRIGESYLSDLDLSRYNHQYNYPTIVDSWSASYQSGYYYPMVDWGVPVSMDRTFTVQDFRVCIYARIIWDQIFAEANYAYESDFLNSEFFSKLIVLPSVANTPGFTNLITTNKNEALIIAQDAQKNYLWDRDVPANNVGNFASFGLALYNWETIEVDTIFFDPNGLYSTASQIYTAPTGQRVGQKIKIDIGLIETGVFYDTWSGLPNFPAGTTPKWTYPNAQGPNPDPEEANFQLRNISDDIRIYVKREYINNGGGATSSNFTGDPTYENIFGNNGYFGGNKMWSNIKFNGNEWYSVRYDKNFNVGYDPITNLWQYSGSITTDLIIDPYTIREGEKIRIFIARPLVAKAGPGLPSYYGTATGTLNEFKLRISDVKATVYFDNTTQVEGGLVNIPQTLANIKQKDYLVSIIRMFNLYIEPSKTALNTFLIEPRDDYYSKYGTTKDWSKKLDLNKPIISEIASNLQNRTQYFSHKPDKDFYNLKYTENTNTVFGEYKFEFENEFTSGESKIETLFSPTPNNLLPKSNRMIIPTIVSINNGNYSNYSGGNPRILYSDTLGLTAGDTYKFWPNGVNVGTAITQNVYPYAGFSDDPFNPTKSINFGDIKSFYSGYNETRNNLYYTYWQNAILELNGKDSRFLTVYFYLNSFDINDFSFADLIYLSVDNMAGYYRVNKILDYDPNSSEPVKVEMVKALNYITDISTIQLDCQVQMVYNLVGTDLTNYLSTVNSYYDTSSNYITWTWNGDQETYYTNLINNDIIGQDSIVDFANEIPGMVATYYPGVTGCSLNFEVEMGEEATNVFVGTLNNLWDNSPENGGAGPDPYVAIFINYPCGSTYGTWQEFNNTYFWDLSGYNDQYTFLDWWLANIPGSYGTASGEILAEGAYLKLGWNWETSCTQSATCSGENLQLYISESSVNYLPGGWTPDLFVTQPILGPTSGPVYDAGGLTYGLSQNICECTEDSITFIWTRTLPCPGGIGIMSNTITNDVGNVVTEILWTASDECICENPSLGSGEYQEQSQGFRSTPVQDQAYSGIINTSVNNSVLAPNNIVTGNNNFIYDSNNIISGDNNGFILGRGNLVMGDENYNIYGSRNFLLGASISTLDGTDNPSVLVGNNISNQYEGAFVFGNNVTLSLPIAATGSTAAEPPITDVFIVGNNISITQSIPSNTTFFGSENIILSQDGGFNTPFIISEAATSSNGFPTGKTIIKTYTGVFGAPSSITTVFPPWNTYIPSYDDIRLWSIVAIDWNIRAESDSNDGWALYSTKGAWYKAAIGYTELSEIGIDTGFFTTTGNATTDITSIVVNTQAVPTYDTPCIEVVNVSGTRDYTIFFDMVVHYQWT